MNGKVRTAFAAVVSITLLAGCGVTAPRSGEGYAELDSLGFVDVDHVLTLSIGPTLMRFAANHMQDEPELGALIRELDGVHIRVFEVNGNSTRVKDRIHKMSRKLQGKGWAPVLLAREGGEEVHMLMKVRDDRISGLTLLASDHQEAVMVNVMGSLQPELFADAMRALDIDAPSVALAY